MDMTIGLLASAIDGDDSTERIEEKYELDNEYVSKKIGEEYKEWKGASGYPRGDFDEGDYIFINSDTGTGKTYFIFSELAQYARENDEKILYLCNRITLKEDANRLKSRLKAYNVDIKTYQNVERILAESKKMHDNDNYIATSKYRRRYLKLYKYKYIVADEMHYFLEDSSFNQRTHYVHRFLNMPTKQVKILISATAGFAIDFYLRKIKYTYKCASDKSYIRLHFYRDNPSKGYDFPVEKMKEILKNNDTDKIIYFVDKKERIERICEKYEDIKSTAHCMFSTSRDDELELNDLDCIHYNSEEEISFNKRILLTTSILSNGVTLKDERIKHIICDIKDIFTTIQCIGRKRALHKNDICDVYIKYYYYDEIKTVLNNARKKYDMCLKLMGERRENTFNEYNDSLSEDWSGCYYVDWLDNGTVKCNIARMEKYYQDMQVYQKIEEAHLKVIDKKNGLDWSYPYINTFEHFSKLSNIEIIKDESKERSYEYLRSILEKHTGKWIPAKGDEFKEIKEAFKQLGVKMQDYVEIAEQLGFDMINEIKTVKRIKHYWIEKKHYDELKILGITNEANGDDIKNENESNSQLVLTEDSRETISSVDLVFNMPISQTERHVEHRTDSEMIKLPFNGYYKNIF